MLLRFKIKNNDTGDACLTASQEHTYDSQTGEARMTASLMTPNNDPVRYCQMMKTD